MTAVSHGVFGGPLPQSVPAQRAASPDLHVAFVLPEGQYMEYSISSAEATVDYLKRIAAWLAQCYGYGDAFQSQASPSTTLGFELKIPGADFLTRDDQLLCSIPYVLSAKQRNVRAVFLLLPRSSQAIKQIKLDDVNIGYLVGRPMRWTAKDDEVTQFRQTMSRERYLEHLKMTSSGIESHIPMQLLSHPVPTAQQSLLVTLFVTAANPTKKVSLPVSETADQFMDRIFPLFVKAGRVLAGSSPRNWVLKPTHQNEYITGPHLMTQFKCIAECVQTGRDIHLDIIERAKIEVLRTNRVSSADVEDRVWSIADFDPNPRYRHHEITCRDSNKRWNSMNVISLWDLIDRPLRFKLVGLEGLIEAAYSSAFVQFDVLEGTTSLLPRPIVSSAASLTEGSTQWGAEWIDSKIQLADLPRAATLSVTVFAGESGNSASARSTLSFSPVCWVNLPLFDHKHELKVGVQSLSMWKWSETDVRAMGARQNRPNFNDRAPTIALRLETFSVPVVFPTEPHSFGTQNMRFSVPLLQPKSEICIEPEPIPAARTMSASDNNEIQRILSSPPLTSMTCADRALLWRHRYLIKHEPKALAKFVQSVPRCDFVARQEMHRLVAAWALIAPMDALELLSADCADPFVRAFAVSRLEELSDDQVTDILLQLVQALKSEFYLDCPLARWLLHRGLRSKLVGHFLYWFLKSEIHFEDCYERNGLLLEAYLRGAGASHLEGLKRQQQFQTQLVELNSRLRDCPKDSPQRYEMMQSEINRINAFLKDAPVQLPLNPFIEVTGLSPEGCRVMSSKQAPLWLSLIISGSRQKLVLFKVGDDLRQDMLTVQLFRIMDKLWKADGLDLNMTPYGVISTGDRIGFVEIVPRSTTICKVHDSLSGIAGALNDELLLSWIQKKNPSKDMLSSAMIKFVSSCAGSCVSTYVMGIGDRHSDNVMITEEGKLVHIDFGHILGNFKSKWGIKRERVPVVLSSDMVYAMGGKSSEMYQQFLSLMVKAFSILRSNARLLINLFTMMLSSGMPELQTVEDVSYMIDMLRPDLSQQDAIDDFLAQIEKSESSFSTKMLWFSHSIAQKLH